MLDIINAHLKDILTFLAGLATGGITGTFFTYKATRNQQAGENVTDQSRARAGRDIVGGNNTQR